MDNTNLPTLTLRRASLACEVSGVLSKPMRGAASIAAAGAHLVGPDPREHFLAFYLDAKGVILAAHVVSIGTATASLVHPREVFGPALMLPGCAALVVAHNHPSGDTEPSATDHATHRRLSRAGALLGIELLDAVVFGIGEDGTPGDHWSQIEHGGGWPKSPSLR